MVSEDFVKIFYSNFTLNIDWDNIDEITWMYNEGLFSMIAQPVALHDEFNERIELVSKPKNGFVRSGENGGHLALKSLARDHLVGHCNVLNGDVRYEYPLIGFEVDVIDKDLHFPVECGDTNVLKLTTQNQGQFTKLECVIGSCIMPSIFVFGNTFTKFSLYSLISDPFLGCRICFSL